MPVWLEKDEQVALVAAVRGVDDIPDNIFGRKRPGGQPPTADHRAGPVAPHDHPERSPDVGGDDELRRAGVDIGSDRLRYHGVLPLKAGQHALLGEQRINLTFRQAG